MPGAEPGTASGTDRTQVVLVVDAGCPSPPTRGPVPHVAEPALSSVVPPGVEPDVGATRQWRTWTTDADASLENWPKSGGLSAEPMDEATTSTAVTIHASFLCWS